MIRVLLLVVSAVMASAPSAGVYRWVDDTGRVHFSDRPHEGSEALVTKQSAKPTQALDVSGESAGTENTLGPYEAFEIVSPEPNQTLRPEGEDIPVALVLNPSLQEGHRLQLSLDGVSMDVDRSLGAQLSLNGVSLGTHTVSGKILDDADMVVAETPALTFHVRKPLPPEILP